MYIFWFGAISPKSEDILIIVPPSGLSAINLPVFVHKIEPINPTSNLFESYLNINFLIYCLKIIIFNFWFATYLLVNGILLTKFSLTCFKLSSFVMS